MTAETQMPPQFPLRPLLIAGVAGEAVFEVLGLLVAPAVLGTPMMPAMLVAGLGGTVGLPMPLAVAWLLHILAGAVLFPLGYLAFRRVTALAGWLLPGMLWALVLWIVAQGLLAPAVGRPFMLGFIPYTWASLVVHGIYALTVAAVFDWLTRAQNPST